MKKSADKSKKAKSQSDTGKKNDANSAQNSNEENKVDSKAVSFDKNVKMERPEN